MSRHCSSSRPRSGTRGSTSEGGASRRCRRDSWPSSKSTSTVSCSTIRSCSAASWRDGADETLAAADMDERASEPRADFGMFERELDGGPQPAELVAGVETLVGERQAVYRL